MELSQPVEWVNKPCVGFFVNANFSTQNTSIVEKLIKDIEAKFGNGIFYMPPEALHITLLDWVAPLVSYDGKDKDELFRQIRPSHHQALVESLAQTKPIPVHFNEIRVSPSTIFIVGHDNGQFQQIRNTFLEKVDLLEGTKMPPTIIHSSLARFTKAMDLSPVREYLAGKSMDFKQVVSGFRLLRSTREPTLEFEIIDQYKLA